VRIDGGVGKGDKLIVGNVYYFDQCKDEWGQYLGTDKEGTIHFSLMKCINYIHTYDATFKKQTVKFILG
jgi:hypothetical protein